jgi:septum formation protein
MVEGNALWDRSFRLVLASKSTSRAKLLRSAGIPFEVDVVDLDERAVEADFFAHGGRSDGLASVLARAKALESSRRNPIPYSLGADQALSFEGGILHKAGSMIEAQNQLHKLSGNTHRLTSAFAIAKGGAIVHEDEDCARMAMRSLDARQIATYLNCVGPSILSSVGIYQLEALGVHLFERIDGDHSTILGLPLLKLLSWLRREGALLL